MGSPRDDEIDGIAKLTWADGRWAILRNDRSWTGDSPNTVKLVTMLPDIQVRVPGAPGLCEWAEELAVFLGAQCEVIGEPEEIDPDAEY